MTMMCDGTGFGLGPETTTGHVAWAMIRSAVEPTNIFFRCGGLWVPTTITSADSSDANFAISAEGSPLRTWTAMAWVALPSSRASFSDT